MTKCNLCGEEIKYIDVGQAKVPCNVNPVILDTYDKYTNEIGFLENGRILRGKYLEAYNGGLLEGHELVYISHYATCSKTAHQRRAI